MIISKVPEHFPGSGRASRGEGASIAEFDEVVIAAQLSGGDKIARASIGTRVLDVTLAQPSFEVALWVPHAL
jgi:hypothetical protein